MTLDVQLCTMKTCNKSPLMLKLIYITLLPVLEAQQDKVWPEVIGYLGHDITLSCQFIQTSGKNNITQSQWDLLPPDGKPITIVVSSSQFGVVIHDSPLERRVEIGDQSLIIKDLKKRDEGLYKCTLSTFPFGSFKRTINLVVRDTLSPGVVSAISISVILLVGVIAGIAYLNFIKRCDFSSVRHHAFIDTGATATDVAQPSDGVKDQDVLYSDVKFKPFRDVNPSSDNQLRNTVYADVTYAKVVLGQPHK